MLGRRRRATIGGAIIITPPKIPIIPKTQSRRKWASCFFGIFGYLGTHPAGARPPRISARDILVGISAIGDRSGITARTRPGNRWRAGQAPPRAPDQPSPRGPIGKSEAHTDPASPRSTRSRESMARRPSTTTGHPIRHQREADPGIDGAPAKHTTGTRSGITARLLDPGKIAPPDRASPPGFRSANHLGKSE